MEAVFNSEQVEETSSPDDRGMPTQNAQDNQCSISVTVESDSKCEHKHVDVRLQSQKIVIYGVDERPPWAEAMFLGFQHFLTSSGSLVAIPLLLASAFCMSGNLVAVSQLVSTGFFVEGIITLLQVTFGIRLPIVQGASFAFVAPAITILNIHGECQAPLAANATAEEVANHTKGWQIRIREIQGALMVASCVEVIVGCTGIIGWLLRFVGPISVATTITLIGIGITPAAAANAGQHWGISALTIALILLFSHFLKNITLPCFGRTESGKIHIVGQRVPIFIIFSVVLGMLLTWLFAFILTISGVFPDNPQNYGYQARTDLNAHSINEAPWFRIPYPGQWGMPTVSVAGVVGMLAAIVVSVIESIGDYYLCARMAGAPPPPAHAINRGIAMEGFGCILAGAWGTGRGVSSYSSNIGAIGLTKVGSRLVVQLAACCMVLVGLFMKGGAILATIPNPIVGGVLCVLFGLIIAVGLSNLQYTNMTSPRNLCVTGFSILMGLVIPQWINTNPGRIQTGISEIDQLLTVTLSTGMLVGGVTALILDNTVPGTLEERGILAWTQQYAQEGASNKTDSAQCYDLPIGMTLIRKSRWARYLPFSPTFTGLEFGNKACCFSTSSV